MVDAPYLDGLIVVVKRDCPTCIVIEPVLSELTAAGQSLHVYSQDDLSFPASPVGGWVNGEMGSNPVAVEVRT